MLVAFNKIDLPAAVDAWPAFRDALAAAGQPVVAISAATGEGIDELRAAARRPAARRRRAGRAAGAGGRRRPPDRARADDASSSSTTDGVLRVRGKRIERLAAQTNFEVEESAERFQRDLARLGIDDELRRRGVGPGDTRPDRLDRARVGGPALGGRDGSRPGAADRRPCPDRDPRRDLRPVPRRPPRASPRRPASSSGLERVLVVPAAPAAAQAGPRDQPGRWTGWRWSSSAIAGRAATRGEPDRARPRRGRRAPSTR